MIGIKYESNDEEIYFNNNAANIWCGTVGCGKASTSTVQSVDVKELGRSERWLPRFYFFHKRRK